LYVECSWTTTLSAYALKVAAPARCRCRPIERGSSHRSRATWSVGRAKWRKFFSMQCCLSVLARPQAQHLLHH
jgi:hypothetical protein